MDPTAIAFSLHKTAIVRQKKEKVKRAASLSESRTPATRRINQYGAVYTAVMSVYAQHFIHLLKIKMSVYNIVPFYKLCRLEMCYGDCCTSVSSEQQHSHVLNPKHGHKSQLPVLQLDATERGFSHTRLWHNLNQTFTASENLHIMYININKLK